jgi:16S rRNA (guanine527-N7)-methyltransferase
VLLDAAQRRCDALRRAVAELDLTARVDVCQARAEEAGRDPELRGAFQLVVARAFGAPGVTAECAAPLLRVGGRLVVSEPPAGSDGRWPPGPLAELGFGGGASLDVGDAHVRVLVQERPCPNRYPRRTGVPAKRPLF